MAKTANKYRGIAFWLPGFPLTLFVQGAAMVRFMTPDSGLTDRELIPLVFQGVSALAIPWACSHVTRFATMALGAWYNGLYLKDVLEASAELSRVESP